MREGLRVRAASGTLRFLDCSRIFDQERATTFSDLWHFSDTGHEILGKMMAQEIAAMLQNLAGRTKPDPALDQR
jgi:lysophospholipase L1-like esterase